MAYMCYYIYTYNNIYIHNSHSICTYMCIYIYLIKAIGSVHLFEARSLPELFDPLRSHATFLMTHLVTHPKFVEAVAFPVLDPEAQALGGIEAIVIYS